MGLDRFNPFKGKPKAVESGATLPETPCEKELATVVKELDGIYGTDEVDGAFGRLFQRELNIEKSLTTPLSPAANQLLKDMEKLEQKYGQDVMHQAVIMVKTRRVGMA